MAQAMSFSEKGVKNGTFTVKDTNTCFNHYGWKWTLGEIQGYAPDLWTFQRSRCTYGYL